MSGKDKILCDAKAICAKYSQSTPSNSNGGNSQNPSNKDRIKSPGESKPKKRKPGKNDSKPDDSSRVNHLKPGDRVVVDL